ncbi:MAG: hypothetical protein JWM99_701 [Verrucomicrobiales bacterium]|jgi:hypothetical protein|nr:hypothetical protein [Verrucomicrobiales bacterium]
MHPTLNPSRKLRGPLLALLGTLVIGQTQSTFAQGCVASRGAGTTPIHGMDFNDEGALPPESGFQASVGYRWLNSDRHFVHDVEQTQRETAGDQVINRSNFIDLGLTYAFTPRYSATVTVPFAIHDRSQVIKSNDVSRTILDRFHTQSAGLGDIRMEGNMWILDPKKYVKGNALIGLGVSAPTGDRDAQDTFGSFDAASKKIIATRKAVDQSIQLGNGGWGITLDLYAYREIIPRLNYYVNGSYTITPEESYTPTGAGRDYSIGDSYMGRTGLEYLVWPKHSLTFSLGGRIEGVPVHDLIGGAAGFRRPGYAVSIEPGIGIAYKTWYFSINTPVALYRNREQSIPDKASGNPGGDAAFADYVVLASLAKRF